jgi:hypothetical protein
MAKLKGLQKWAHKDVISELWALERELDSRSQKDPSLGKQLGRVRSIILRVGANDQKTLKRWTKPAPNQIAQAAPEPSSAEVS